MSESNKPESADPWADTSLINVGQLLTRAARNWPDHPAIAEPSGTSWRHVSYRQLDEDSSRIAIGLAKHGIRPGTRVAMLVPPGIDFVTLVFALLKSRAVVILVDPGIGKKNLIQCLADSRPESIVGIAKAQIARWLYRSRFPEARKNFVVGKSFWPGCRSIDKLRREADTEFNYVQHDSTEAAAVIFTSGSTGPPKGVAYSHRNFINQAIEIRDYFEIQPGGADVSGFPLFALFNSAMGKTTVFPNMDFTRPAEVSPQAFLGAAEYWNADQAFGSPALWNTVSIWCEENHRRMPTIKRALSAGAPVPAHVMKRLSRVIADDGEIYTPYGATEALPVACNSASIVLNETSKETDLGKGVCVGGRFSRIDWKVIPVSDDPISTMDQVEALPIGEIGELVVAGPVVTTHYVTRTDANSLAKIKDGDRIWHRMGDLGYLDEHRRFWFCGRKSQRVVLQNRTLYTVPCESIMNTHPAIYRSALVSQTEQGERIPVIVAEPWPQHWPATNERRHRLIRELQELASKNEMTRDIQRFRIQRQLPVDIRHNSKIFREQLARSLEQDPVGPVG